MSRKYHLQHTSKSGSVCRAGKIGAALEGREHITLRTAEFAATRPELQCERCKSSSLFAFLSKKLPA